MISYRHQCVFVHIPKNGGQAVEHVFLDAEALDWKSRASLLLRPRRRGERGPPRLAHLRAEEYHRYGYLAREDFDRYFKFAFVRNPWSRAVSFYRYLGFDRRCSFARFVEGWLTPQVNGRHRWFVGPQLAYLQDADAAIAVDFVGRLERMDADFAEVCARLGMAPTPLPRVNDSGRHRYHLGSVAERASRAVQWGLPLRRAPALARFQDYYDRRTRGRVAALYAQDIEAFGYGFDG